MDNREGSPVILVVGKDPPKASKARSGKYDSYKASVAAVLSRGGYNVKETTDITDLDHGEPLVNGRRWISKNSLRRLEGQNVKVICAMDARGCYDEDWVNIMCLIFEKHSPCVAAVRESKHVHSDKHLEKFFSDFYKSTVLETMNNACLPHLKRIIQNLEPFEIKTQPLGLIGKKDVRAWSSEKVILFGRTGSGKSTLAQMLTLGRLNAPGSATEFEASSSASGSPSTFKASPSARGSPGIAFEASSNARGMTKDIERGEGRGWHVTDTPGFGEAKEGTVSTEDATKIIKKFVIDMCGIYSHYLYVVKKDRVNIFDEKLWEFFKRVFAGAEQNFSVVVTCCMEDLSQQDRNHLKKTFTGCKNFIYVDNPPVDKDSDIEEENKDVRGQSLRELEDRLAELGVADKVTSEGVYSRENKRFVKSDIAAKWKDFSIMGDSMDAIYAQLLNYLVVRPISGVQEIFHKSKIDDSFLLLPQF